MKTDCTRTVCAALLVFVSTTALAQGTRIRDGADKPAAAGAQANRRRDRTGRTDAVTGARDHRGAAGKESPNEDSRGGLHRRGTGVPGAVVINPITMGQGVRTGSFDAAPPVQIGNQIVVGPPGGGPEPRLDEFGVRPPGTGARADDHPRRRSQRPSFVFVPWFPVGARLMAGFPVADPIESGDVTSSALLGGLSFSLTPSQADVLVDGTRVGMASTYSPASDALRLRQGTHRVEIRAAGFQPERFVVHVTAGEVLPVAGTLEPEP